MTDRRRSIRTPEELRLLAHPVRIALLETLGFRGPMTATQVADVVGESPSNCSWHLRKLAELSLVERAEATNERDRPWRLTFDTYDNEGAEPAASKALASLVAHRSTDRMLDAMHGGLRPGFFTTSRAWLTKDEMLTLVERLQSILAEFTDQADERRDHPELRPEGAMPFELVSWAARLEDDAAEPTSSEPTSDEPRPTSSEQTPSQQTSSPPTATCCPRPGATNPSPEQESRDA